MPSWVAVEDVFAFAAACVVGACLVWRGRR